MYTVFVIGGGVNAPGSFIHTTRANRMIVGKVIGAREGKLKVNTNWWVVDTEVRDYSFLCGCARVRER